ncbi:hypothetical protein OC842_000335 [Tilletia horrida]|uniref:Uncharacterized protein n=1 Tax=Tilletia horrida TaxID=155126 RepID=A0AAN6GHS9_9BASI|nr:hypothetical protein OC842_000335 [Tilletia horrida]
MIPPEQLCGNIQHSLADQIRRLAINHNAPFPLATTGQILARVLNGQDQHIDHLLLQHNRAYPKGCNGLWKSHLVSLLNDVEPLLGSASDGRYSIQRAAQEDLIGVKMFDELRSQTLHVRSLQAFQVAFQHFTGGILAGLNFDNVFVAGGSVNAALTDPDASNFGARLRKSDVDIFLYDLTDFEMVNKVAHVQAVLRNNISDFHKKYVTERSGGAVTFIPNDESGRRVQIVLRAHLNPAEILAHFDLDQARVGYDGDQVWLNMMAVRAWVTGYSICTGHISSSFAGRIVKYASRGWGLLVKIPLTQVRQKHTVEVQSMVDEKKETLKRDFLRYPWDGVNNFKMLYVAVKRAVMTNWTHTFADLNALAGLWSVAHSTGHIRDLMDELGCSHSTYSLYHSPEDGGNVDDWKDVMANIRNEASATDILKDIEEALKSVYEHKDGQDVSFNKNMAAAIEKAQVQLDCVRERAQKDLDDLHRRTTQEIADVQRQMEQETEEAKKARQEGRSEAVGRVMGLLQRLKDGVVGDVRGLCDMLKSSATETEVRAKAAQSGWLRVQTQLFGSNAWAIAWPEAARAAQQRVSVHPSSVLPAYEAASVATAATPTGGVEESD